MPRWIRFETGEVDALKTIVDADVETTESYEKYLEGGEGTCDNAGPEVQQEQIAEAIARRTIGEVILDKLREGGIPSDPDASA